MKADLTCLVDAEEISGQAESRAKYFHLGTVVLEHR